MRCKVPSTPIVSALNAFVAWILAVEPWLEIGDTMEETIKLGILADHLGAWALSNQAQDLLKSQVDSGAWEWSPQPLDEIYGELSARATPTAFNTGYTPHYA